MLIKSLNRVFKLLLLTWVITVVGASANFQTDIIKACTEYKSRADVSPDNLCKLYINGFIDAGILNSLIEVSENDAANEANIDANKKGPSDFFKRAYKYRLMDELKAVSNKSTAEVCLPAHIKREYLVSQIAQKMNLEELGKQPVKYALFKTLSQEFPCE